MDSQKHTEGQASDETVGFSRRIDAEEDQGVSVNQ